MEQELKADPIGLVEYVAKSLVGNPDDVQVQPVWSPTSLIIELHVNENDVGAVIGKNGRIARAMRSLLSSISVKNVAMPDDENRNLAKIVLEIIDQS